MVKHLTIAPSDSLKKFVRCFWVLESDEPQYTHQSIADVCPELIFHYSGIFDQILSPSEKIKSFQSGIHGQTKKVTNFKINSSFGIFGVYLYPYAIPCLLGLPATEINDQLVDLSSLLGRDGLELEEKMLFAKDNYRRIEIITAFLENKLLNQNPNSSIVSAVNFIIHSQESIKVKKLAETYALSERQFERKFKELTGFTPKLFYRISRFSSTIKEYNSNYKTLSEIAYRCGYYDQAHFIQDFKEFSGHNPRYFFSGGLEGFRWLDG